MGFGERFRGVVNQLYSKNVSSVVVNDGLTEQIYLGRGTRQGCPLSPILFALVMEILAHVFREDRNIGGIGIRETINLFADDTLLTIENPMENMDRVENHLKEFGEVTGLQINWDKSKFLLFNYSKREEIEMCKKKVIIRLPYILKYKSSFSAHFLC